MKVSFGDLDNMLSELEEKGISEVRIETLWDQKAANRGLSLIRLYVSVEALLTASLIASYEKVTFSGLKPFEDSKMKELHDKQRRAGKEMIESLEARGFVVRGGHFEEE